MRSFATAVLLSALMLIPGNVPAADLPLWEAGAGFTVFGMSDYRGSDQERLYAFPIPYLVYRGEVLKVDRRAIRGIFYKTDTVELDASFSGSPPVESDENDARRGMPDLDPSLEAGPNLKWTLAGRPDGTFRAQLHFPVRAVLMSDLSYVRLAGYVFDPRLNVEWGRIGGDRRWSAGIAVGPVFTDTSYSRTFYGVTPLYATGSRPACSPRGGYGGMQLTFAASGRTGPVWLGAFARLDSLHGARFEDSPLVRAKWSHVAGIAVSWVLGGSDTKVQVDEW